MSQVPGSTSNSTLLGNCLSCQGLVRVPIKTRADSSVRCPHCQQSYPLSEILAQLVPELEVLEPSHSGKAAENIPHVDQVLLKTDAITSGEKFIVPIQLSEGAKRRRHGRRKSTADGGREGSEGDDYRLAPLIETGSDERSRQRSAASSPSRRPRVSGDQRRTMGNDSNGVVEAFKMMLGAAMAIPIAYLLVMGLFKQDPLHLGPWVSSKVPFLVPEELHESPSAVTGTERP